MNVPEPNVMNLATVDEQGRPDSRTVLLKGLDERGFIFYTNYHSQKGNQLLANPFAAINFLWLQAERQVRVKGSIEKLSESASTKYFQSRPKGSQLGAWASPQSEIIASREVLDENLKKLEQKHADDEVLPKPPNWGGYLLRPDVIIFWQGRPSRLHDRFRYNRTEDGNWVINRLAP